MLATRPQEIGAAITQARLDKGWTQQELATRVGVSRQWINSAEAGSPNARIGLILRTLRALAMSAPGLRLNPVARSPLDSQRARRPRIPTPRSPARQRPGR